MNDTKNLPSYLYILECIVEIVICKAKGKLEHVKLEILIFQLSHDRAKISTFINMCS